MWGGVFYTFWMMKTPLEILVENEGAELLTQSAMLSKRMGAYLDKAMRRQCHAQYTTLYARLVHRTRHLSNAVEMLRQARQPELRARRVSCLLSIEGVKSVMKECADLVGVCV